MKSIVLIYENVADQPDPELDGRTPLEVARCPAAARLVSEGWGGYLGKPARGSSGSAESLLAHFCGFADSADLVARGPLEAAAAGCDLAGFTHAYRGDLVTSDDGLLRDGRPARLTLQETAQLAQSIQQMFDPARVFLHAHGPGRVAVLVRAEGDMLDPGRAPWLLEGEEVEKPEGRSSAIISEMLEKSAEVLARQTINDVRVDLGENPASVLWLWGGGPLARLAPTSAGCVQLVTQSAMAAGLGRLAGIATEPLLDPWSTVQPADVVDADRVRAWLHEHDRLVYYVEAPPVLYRGAAREKVHVLERMDMLLTQPLLDVFRRVKERRFLLAGVEAAVPAELSARRPHLLALWGSHMEPDAVAHWDEPSCRNGRLAGMSIRDVTRLLTGE